MKYINYFQMCTGGLVFRQSLGCMEMHLEKMLQIFFFIERLAFASHFLKISLLVLRIGILFYLFSIILSFFPPPMPGTKLTNHTVKLSCALMLMSKYGSC